jgi:hypothetical protein
MCCSSSTCTTGSICPALPDHAHTAHPTSCHPRPLVDSRRSFDCNHNRLARTSQASIRTPGARISRAIRMALAGRDEATIDQASLTRPVVRGLDLVQTDEMRSRGVKQPNRGGRRRWMLRAVAGKRSTGRRSLRRGRAWEPSRCDRSRTLHRTARAGAPTC